MFYGKFTVFVGDLTQMSYHRSRGRAAWEPVGKLWRRERLSSDNERPLMQISRQKFQRQSANLHRPTMGVRKRLPCSKALESDKNDGLTEMAYTLVRLFQRFGLIARAEIVMQPGNGIKVGL